MKGFSIAALIGAGLVAVTASAVAGTMAPVSLFDASYTGDTSLFAPGHSAFADLTRPANLFSGLQADPTALPPLGSSLLAPEGATRSADLALTSALHFDFSATRDQLSLIPTYDQFNPLGGDAWQSKSLLTGLSWNFANWGGIGLTARQDNYFVMSSDRPALSAVSRVNNDALGVSAHLGLGGGWITTASYSEGLSQLDLRPSATPDMHTQSYSFSIAKHGLFGDDALGFSFSQPAAGTANNDLASLVASDNLPPVYTEPHFSDSAPQETDFQLGYVTSYLNGALALQTNASYQMNVQGQSGANAVTLLSRAKIKF